MQRHESIAVTLEPARSVAEIARALVATTKPGITRMVCITAGVGFVMAGVSRVWMPVDLILTALVMLVGTALSASGANALNQWMERGRDACMRRTAGRPIPAGVLTPNIVLAAGIGLVVSGVSVLLVLGPAPASVSAACVASYLLLYTPLKPVTIWSTLVGAVPGALPPLIGWTAARGTDGGVVGGAGGFSTLLEPGGQALFWLMLVWQLPHFWAIAWMHRDDYERGGHRVLPVVDRVGRATAWAILVSTIAMVLTTFLPAWAMPDQLGWPYLAVVCVSGVVAVWFAARLVRTRDAASARRVFFASIVHLPVLFLAMAGEALLRVAA